MTNAYDREDSSSHPPLLHPDYKATLERAAREPVRVPQKLTEKRGPTEWTRIAGTAVTDLTRAYAGAPIGERTVRAT